MLTLKVDGKVVSLPMTEAECADRIGKAAGSIKVMCAIGNNAAWAVVLEAHDYVKRHPAYRQKVKQAFKAVLEAFHAYERGLIYADTNRMFHVADLTPEYRKRYGDITDREYYEYWCGTGAVAWKETHAFITSLHNKFRLSLKRHGVQFPELVAWPMTACACLKMSVAIYEQSLDWAVRSFELPAELCRAIFKGFDLTGVCERWDRALTMLEPWTGVYNLEEDERKNIQLGLDQLLDKWTHLSTIQTSLRKGIEAYEEVFRTKGEMKKALREVAGIQ